MTANTNPLPSKVDGIPRRACLDHNHPAELAIRAALHAVEALGADPLLTDAVTALGTASALVADWLEGGQKPEPPRILSLEEQFAQLQAKWPTATIEAREFGNGYSKWTEHLVTIPDWPLPPGYSRPTCTVYFVLPNGYPYAPPDRFYTDAVTLEGGAMPYYARTLVTESRGGCTPEKMGSFPAPAGTVIWFWKVASWDARQNTLKTYAHVIRARLDRPEAQEPPFRW